jgi:mannose-6-phosphate isomerase
MQAIYPLLFEPVYQSYLWGGDWFVSHYQRGMPPGVYAESWEISDRPEGASRVRNGALQGTTLAELMAADAQALLGYRADRFPLLVKLLDARQTLSVQVHPDDAGAAAHGGEAKTEMWYVLDAEPEACVYAGWKDSMDAARFQQALAKGTLQDLLQRVAVQAGDVVFMPGGRVHAIGAGCRLLEVQQNSNTTYRLYDWGRTGADGQPRPLHVEAALPVIEWSGGHEAIKPVRRIGHMGRNQLWELLASRFFRMERLEVNESWPTAHDGATCHLLFVERGRVAVAWDAGELEAEAGTSILIPAALRAYTLTPMDDEAARVIRTTPPAGTDH